MQVWIIINNTNMRIKNKLPNKYRIKIDSGVGILYTRPISENN